MYTIPLYCTSALYTFSHTVWTNESRARSPKSWFEAMNQREVYRNIKSDYYTHAHDLPPQLGGCEENGDDEQLQMKAQIDGTDGESWNLPLPPLSRDSLGKVVQVDISLTPC